MSYTLNKASYGKLTREQMILLSELRKRKGMQSLANVVKGIELDWFQTESLMHSLITKGSIVSLDTGLGKTLVAIGHMNILKATYPQHKTLFVCERSNFEKTIEKIKMYSNLKVIGTTAEGDVLWNDFLTEQPLTADVWVITYQSLQNFRLSSFLFENRALIGSLIVDESHKIGNATSYTHNIIRAIAKNIEYKLFLTATPLRVSPRQMINQIEMIDRSMFEDKEKYCMRFEERDTMGAVIGHKDLDILAEDLSIRFIGYTREQLGLRGNYNVRLVLSESKPEYFKVDRSQMNQLIKADPEGDAMRCTLNEVWEKAQEGKKGLIYANLNQTKSILYSKLKEVGIKVDIIDGSLSNVKLRGATQDAFNRGDLDVIIINVTTALDLQCDYIIFHELTVDSKQMIGRGERGLKANDLELIYIISEFTVEVDYFIENVYNRGVLLKTLANKEIKELESVKQQLESKHQFLERDFN